MHNLSKSWTDETIALLLNKELVSVEDDPIESNPHHQSSIPMRMSGPPLPPQSIRIHRPKITDKNQPHDGNYVLLEFASTQELDQVVGSFQGIAVPMTHGYHHFTFEDESASEDTVQSAIAECSTPPLHLQLLALSTAELESRLGMYSPGEVSQGTETKKRKRRNNNKRNRVHAHALAAYRLGKYLNGKRPNSLNIEGVHVPLQLTDPLLQCLRRCTLWPPRSKQRKGVASGNYLTIRKTHPPECDELWEVCANLLKSVIIDHPSEEASSSFEYTALAITKQFCGSPHIDQHDTSFQFVIAVGDFTGGDLCVDAGSSNEEVCINVHNRLGRLDGRSVHWVSGWKGERYSVVYYSTDQKHFTEPVGQRVHNDWMDRMRMSVQHGKSID